MKFKTLALAAVVAATVLGTASTADAQFRARRSSGYSYAVPYSNYSYSTPYSYGSSYNYSPSYSYGSSYYTPAYDGVTSVGSYAPLGGTSMVIPSGGVYSYPSYNSSSYYTPGSSYPSYGPSYNNGLYNNSYYNGYNNGINVSPFGGSFYGHNWRW